MSDTEWGSLSIPMAVRGVVLGVGAFVIGLVFTHLTAADVATRAARAFEPLANAGGQFVPSWKASGWIFLDGHFVGTTYPGGSVDMVSMASVQYVYLVPIILCLLAGGMLAWTAGTRTSQSGMIAGLSLVFGYLPMAIIFAILLQHGNATPSLLRATVVAGLGYPILLGGIGGVLATVLQRED